MCLNPYLTYRNNKGKVIPLQKLKEKSKYFKNLSYIYNNEEFYKALKSEQLVQIPCGKCLECIKSKYAEWSKRIKKELKQHKTNFIINLTYDNENLKELNKRDLQLFFKKLRKKYKVRYFYVGELGEEKQRPHYHIIMFGMKKPNDLKEIEKTKRGNKQFTSQEITNTWGMGRVTINVAEPTEIGYLFKYMFKNSSKKDFIMQMSKKPPIGINPNTIEKDILKLDRTKGLKRYYKYHIGNLPEIQAEIDNYNQKIKETEKQTKIKYYYYLQKKFKSN